MISCKICIALKGLKGTDNPSNCSYVFEKEAEFIKHLKKEHNLSVKPGGKESIDLSKMPVFFIDFSALKDMFNGENKGRSADLLKKLKEMKKDDTVRNLLESKFDRETIAVLLGIDKKEIAEILQRCSYSESFIQTANDLQIMDAISGCYEEYKILKKR